MLKSLPQFLVQVVLLIPLDTEVQVDCFEFLSCVHQVYDEG